MAFFSVDASGSVISFKASSEELRVVNEKLARAYSGSELPEAELKELSNSELSELTNQALDALASSRARA